MPDLGDATIKLSVDTSAMRAALTALAEAYAGLADYMHEAAAKIDGAIETLGQLDVTPVSLPGDPR